MRSLPPSIRIFFLIPLILPILPIFFNCDKLLRMTLILPGELTTRLLPALLQVSPPVPRYRSWLLWAEFDCGLCVFFSSDNCLLKIFNFLNFFLNLNMSRFNGVNFFFFDKFDISLEIWEVSPFCVIWGLGWFRLRFSDAR